MFTKCYISHIFLLTLLALACGQYVNNLTPKQRSRIRPNYKDETSNLTSADLINLKSRDLFRIIHRRMENRDLEVDPCETPTFVMPDFQSPGLRLSDVKCLENLWKIRYYDEALISAAYCTNNSKSSGVYSIVTAVAGGLDGIAGEFPHMGAIGWQTVRDSWLFMCEGALVSEKFMVTAAHCSQLPKPHVRVDDLTPKIVRLGEVNISDEERIGKSPKDVFINRFILHPYYKLRNKNYDIALIEFKDALVLTSKVYPACIWTNQFELKGPAELAGWNTIESNKTVAPKEFISDSFDVFTRLTLLSKISNSDLEKDPNATIPVLRVAKVNVRSMWTCYKWMNQNILYNQFCAERRSPNETNCQDTSGVLSARINMPEYTDWHMHYLIGVKSFNRGCDNENKRSFSVYTKVSVFIEWIEGIVWGKDAR
ncbi:PREDICTED: coagulation factor IX-like isoform X2 [Papilio polytes]|uniref:coagulation factor IX-like isoform X2 n=1 Tax=Papilio polytes TaxID=76194 RepID=UPI0006761E3A|nr:PREDICTED: coagulation factor IX-like isoform X2 [Papilio polytes]